MGQNPGKGKQWKWRECHLPPAALEKLEAFGLTDQKPDRIWQNELYEVWVRNIRWMDSAPMVWLSIKRRDKQPIRAWRHMQRIKNELVGPECEGFELFPAESRLADSANQYHLFVFTDSDVRLPVGFPDRLVMTPEQAAQIGAVQAPFEDD